MTIYILVFLWTLLMVAAMAIGVIIKGKRLLGSCGGIGCGSCSKTNTCTRQTSAQKTLLEATDR